MINIPEEDPVRREANRQKFLAEVESFGISRADGHLIFDLVIKAKRDAFMAMDAVAETAPPHLKTVVMASALSNLSDRLIELTPEITLLAMVSVAKARRG